MSQLGTNCTPLIARYVVWSSLAHPLGNTQKVFYSPFIHCNLAKWEQSKGALQLSSALQRGCATGAIPLYQYKYYYKYYLFKTNIKYIKEADNLSMFFSS